MLHQDHKNFNSVFRPHVEKSHLLLTETFEVEQSESGHAGGDYALMKSFVTAVTQRDPSVILSGPAESLETHLTVFAAEQARRERRIVQVI